MNSVTYCSSASYNCVYTYLPKVTVNKLVVEELKRIVEDSEVCQTMELKHAIHCPFFIILDFTRRR